MWMLFRLSGFSWTFGGFHLHIVKSTFSTALMESGVDQASVFALHSVSLLPSADGSTAGMGSESTNNSRAAFFFSPTISSFMFSLFPSPLFLFFACSVCAILAHRWAGRSRGGSQWRVFSPPTWASKSFCRRRSEDKPVPCAVSLSESSRRNSLDTENDRRVETGGNFFLALKNDLHSCYRRRLDFGACWEKIMRDGGERSLKL